MIFSSPATFTPKIPWVPARPSTDSLPFRIITAIAKGCLNFLRLSYEMCCSVARFFKNPYQLKRVVLQETALPSPAKSVPLSSPSKIPELHPEPSPLIMMDNQQDLEFDREHLESSQEPLTPPKQEVAHYEAPRTPQQVPKIEEKSIVLPPSTEQKESPCLPLNEVNSAEVIPKKEVGTAWKVAGCIAFFLAGALVYPLLFPRNNHALEGEIFLLKEQVSNLTHRLTAIEETCYPCKEEPYVKGLFDGLNVGKSFCIKALMQHANKIQQIG